MREERGDQLGVRVEERAQVLGRQDVLQEEVCGAVSACVRMRLRACDAPGSAVAAPPPMDATSWRSWASSSAVGVCPVGAPAGG